MVRLTGPSTRYGDVLKRLLDFDDDLVIFGAGDEVTLQFDSTELKDVPAGWQRSFVFRAWGYCKSADPLTAYSDTIEPLPFRGMEGYPQR